LLSDEWLAAGRGSCGDGIDGFVIIRAGEGLGTARRPDLWGIGTGMAHRFLAGGITQRSRLGDLIVVRVAEEDGKEGAYRYVPRWRCGRGVVCLSDWADLHAIYDLEGGHSRAAFDFTSTGRVYQSRVSAL